MATRNTASWYLIGWWMYTFRASKMDFWVFSLQPVSPTQNRWQNILSRFPHYFSHTLPQRRSTVMNQLGFSFSEVKALYHCTYMYLVFYIREVLRHDQDTQILHLHMVRLTRKKYRKFCGKPWQHRTQLRGETACARSIRRQRLNILFSGQGFTTDGHLQIMHSSLWERQNAQW